MCGRAGRAGHCAAGDAILCVPKEEATIAQVVESVLTGRAEDCISALLLPDGALPPRLVLAAIASGIAPSLDEVCASMDCVA